MDGRELLRQSIAAALEALAVDVPERFLLDYADLTVERTGDALRISVEVPAAVARWLEQRTDRELEELGERAKQRIERTTLPGGQEREGELLEAALVVRDRVESSVMGIGRVSLGQGKAPGTLLAPLRRALRAFDQSLSGLTSREDAERLLGDRAWLLGSNAWTQVLSVEEGTDDPEGPEIGDTLAMGAAPTSRVIAEYIELGDYHRWVEGVAERSADFARDLLELIGTSLDMDEQVGFAARLWQSRQRSSMEGAPTSSAALVDLPLRFAMAADTGVERQTRVVRLGKLLPLEAVGVMSADAEGVELRVFAESGVVRRVRLGEETADAPTAESEWRVRISHTEEPVTILVEASDGRAFEAAIRLVDRE